MLFIKFNNASSVRIFNKFKLFYLIIFSLRTSNDSIKNFSKKLLAIYYIKFIL